MTVTIIQGDVRDVLPALPADSVDCIVTSPPYWGLRDYGCAGQIGLEPTLDAYLETMVDICRELRRVLKPSGTFWLNIGDSYAGSWGAQGRAGQMAGRSVVSARQIAAHPRGQTGTGSTKRIPGLKPKDLCLAPARLALALQADGWWVRSEIIWAKPNPMPESVTDRPTSAHEKIYLLTKSATYFYDAEAVKEASVSDHPSGNGFKRDARLSYADANGARGNDDQWIDVGGRRNLRNVWSINSKPFADAHFATFPPALAERCIKAGCPSGGNILDPFGGAGTTGLVADRLGRDCTLIELNQSYVDLSRTRIMDDAPLLTEIAAE